MKEYYKSIIIALVIGGLMYVTNTYIRLEIGTGKTARFGVTVGHKL